MQQQEEQFFAESRKKVRQYLSNRLLLIKLQTVEKIAKLASAMFAGLIIAVLGFFILLFLSIMAGYLFAALTHSLFLGFGIVTLFYIILLIVLVAMRKRILEKFIVNTVIKIIFDQTEPKENGHNN
ncbi:phage holin family protein [Deminuibacter soli]|uniref:Phage holin family protein n=1 Tax=Deminuibacter soli TaxID=2291815 RepID=A0A3E1NFK5_9BACT|nr:phage holin family protein [Deminuibacter soli]RFM26568.1 hypothetical protein DXN05_18495 [Deminuibacter soli]